MTLECIIMLSPLDSTGDPGKHLRAERSTSASTQYNVCTDVSMWDDVGRCGFVSNLLVFGPWIHQMILPVLGSVSLL